jgi:hypothetical protein
MTIMPSWPLNPAGPAQSENLIHFCGRPPGRPHTPWIREDIKTLLPEQRLGRILWEQQILGFGPFGPKSNEHRPMVCLSESPQPHLEWLLTQHWPPWGVIFSRRWVYDVDGGPVWYARPQQYSGLTPDQHPWVVPFDTVGKRNDWVHEREWRIPVQRYSLPALPLRPGDIAAVLIGKFDWQPASPFQATLQRWYLDPGTRLWWYWDPASQLWWQWNFSAQRFWYWDPRIQRFVFPPS